MSTLFVIISSYEFTFTVWNDIVASDRLTTSSFSNYILPVKLFGSTVVSYMQWYGIQLEHLIQIKMAYFVPFPFTQKERY